jgi:hypothetical protein
MSVFNLFLGSDGSWGSKVCIVSDYRLDNRGSILAEANDFSFFLCAQTSSEAHPASYEMGTESPFPGGRGVRGRGVALTTHPV